MSLTLVEVKLLEYLRTIRDYLTMGTVTKGEYHSLMTSLRDAIKTLENKKHGCPTGAHSDYCTCTTTTPGINTDYYRWKKKHK